MAAVIRLSRQGNKDRPFYKIVVTDKRNRRDGRPIEVLGTYNPLNDGENSEIDLKKAEDWLSKGAKPSETVLSIIKKERKKSGAAA